MKRLQYVPENTIAIAFSSRKINYQLAFAVDALRNKWREVQSEYLVIIIGNWKKYMEEFFLENREKTYWSVRIRFAGGLLGFETKIITVNFQIRGKYITVLDTHHK